MLTCSQGGQAEPCFPPHPTSYQTLRFAPLFEFTQNLGLTRAESTFKMIKAEFVYSRRFDSLYQLQLELADYVHWFNNIRLHGTLGYLSPAEFKKTCTL